MTENQKTEQQATAKEKPEHRWTAKGEISGRKTKDEDIKIKECKRCINQTAGEVFGKPIDVNLGIRYIKDFWDRVKSSGMLSFYHKYTELANRKKPTPMAGNSKLNEDTDNFLQDTDTWLKDLLLRSFALTYDKNILLKILSQPKCEGIRIYMALKDLDKAKPGFGPNGTFTFVSVGVDVEGKDLHYEDLGGPSSLVDIENESLCGEYPGQPVTLKSEGDDKVPNPIPGLYGLYEYGGRNMYSKYK